MDYLLPYDPDDSSTNPAAPFAVFLWSTAMAPTLRPMLEAYLKPWKSQILGVWNRDDLKLRDESSYRGNPDTFKDLDKLFNHLDEKKGTGAAFRQLPVDWLPSIDNTILIEKSISKCRLQPLNLLPITDYDESEYARTIEAIRQQAHQAENGNTGAGLLRLIFGCEASDFYANSTRMLLAVIGILSELQYVANVPVWIAAGGLEAHIEHTFTESMAKGGWANILETDRGAKQSDLAASTIVNGQTSNGLPTCADGEMWYKSPIHVLYWIRRGLKALNKRGIEPRHGLLVQSTSSW
ncbi:hypothetical protein QFC20_000830 [Naganishia adeliensis]|uniref:Uncharacterized protein n=1 Tax=Naganishia adeliensis TaxID=92952 RepID=A0ACC2WXW2_9TREE|nr:hypothetical protein QFC20_000830 [Naganishia adeliensis]